MNNKRGGELPQPLKDLGSSVSTIKKDKLRYKVFSEEVGVHLSPKDPPYNYFVILFTNSIYKNKPVFCNTNCIYRGVKCWNFVIQKVNSIIKTNKGVSS